VSLTVIRDASFRRWRAEASTGHSLVLSSSVMEWCLCVPTDKRACCSQRLPVLFRALRFRVSVLRAFITEAKGIHYVGAVRVYLRTRSLEVITRLHGHSCTKRQSCIASVVRCKKSHFPFSAELIYIFVCSSQRMRVGTRILCEEQKTPIGRRGLEHQVCKLPCTYSPTFLLRRDLGFGSYSW